MAKYKTEICKNFSETGQCKYRGKCQFAHGPHELNIPGTENSVVYRTKKCENFWKKGFCYYGSRCNFMHNDREKHKYDLA